MKPFHADQVDASGGVAEGPASGVGRTPAARQGTRCAPFAVAAALCVLFLGGGCSDHGAAPTTGSASGTVALDGWRTDAGGMRLAPLRVATATGVSVQTGGNGGPATSTLEGSWSLTALASGDYTVLAGDPPIQSTPLNVAVRAGEATRVAPLVITEPASAIQSPYPNPHGGAVAVAFAIVSTTHVRLDILDMKMQVVRILVDDVRSAGVHVVAWDDRDTAGDLVPPGPYWLLFEADSLSTGHRLIVVESP